MAKRYEDMVEGEYVKIINLHNFLVVFESFKIFNNKYTQIFFVHRLKIGIYLKHMIIKYFLIIQRLLPN